MIKSDQDQKKIKLKYLYIYSSLVDVHVVNRYKVIQLYCNRWCSVFFQLNSPEDNTTLVNLIYFLQERQRRRQTLIDDLSRKGMLLQTMLIKSLGPLLTAKCGSTCSIKINPGWLRQWSVYFLSTKTTCNKDFSFLPGHSYMFIINFVVPCITSCCRGNF